MMASLAPIFGNWTMAMPSTPSPGASITLMASVSSFRKATGCCLAKALSHDHIMRITSGWSWATAPARSPWKCVSLTRPHPANPWALTFTSPVACSAAWMPASPSTITLSPMVITRSGSAGDSTRPGREVDGLGQGLGHSGGGDDGHHRRSPPDDGRGRRRRQR